MGQLFWIASVVAAIAVIFGVGTIADQTPQSSPLEYETASAEPEIGEPETFFISTDGSALASAAFGLSALQPETYNGEIVLDIIDASPLERTEKRRLALNLEAAEAGQADLHIVLEEVRVSLAIE